MLATQNRQGIVAKTKLLEEIIWVRTDSDDDSKWQDYKTHHQV